ncbi:CmcJ/NvfI family oxidoreductase [Pendulispora albinea]|uniref:Methyltransferase n=1 Tax=Pendulispora albinea TaxID=2741071 RepID=A0ABZ2M9H9_9BACT
MTRSSVGRPDTEGVVSYLLPTSERPVEYLYPPPEGAVLSRHAYEPRTIAVRDARCLPPSELSIDRNGFELRSAPTAVRDFLDDEEVRRVAYPEMAAVALAVTGAREVHVFDHVVRKREPDRPPLLFGVREGLKYPSATGRVHNDYTETSGQRRLGMVLQDPEKEAAVKRYAIVNLWRSIAQHPVLDTPLALCDPRTVAPTDLVPTELRYRKRTGEIYTAVHSAEHRWWYFPAMQRDEILVFKQYDSEAGEVARFTPHAAFDHPETPPDHPPRESMEVRCLLVYA